MPQITLTRRFHAVGQGLFCSEVVESPSINFRHTTVYDCGTTSNPTILQQEIEGLANTLDYKKIDILFLSHLHKDHISGIEQLMNECYVKKVVLPQLEPFQIIRAYLSKSSNAPSFSDQYDDSAFALIDRVFASRDRHGDTDYVEVPAFVEPLFSSKLSNKEGNNELYNPNALSQYKNLILKDYTFPISLPTEEAIIEYIPFNIESPQKTIFNILAAKYFPNLYDQLQQGDFTQLQDEKLQELTKLYLHIFRGLNESSMPVLSHVIPQIPRPLDCLYTGDYTNKTDKNVEKLKAFYNDEWDKIAYIQVPHHGSRYGNPVELYQGGPHECMVSYGVHNRYNHPHQSAINAITKNAQNTLYQINDNAETFSKIDSFNI
ncbi:MAG: MBL fold metallo-hydrolase [Bacteroidales bacterium]|nr:MBL fold metallo-hydrolase [Bacteroidales bacterium]